jgi:TonB family protein
MKKCGVCEEEFAEKFVFCPIDGKALDENLPSVVPCEFNLTLVDDARLSERLLTELQFVLKQLKQAWPSFKENPVEFTQAQLIVAARRIKRTLARPHFATSAMTAMFLLAAVVLGVLFLERHSPKRPKSNDEGGDLAELTMINLNEVQATSGTGVGVGDRGRVGINSGKGEGSAPVPAKSHGGGSGGDRNPNPSSVGKVPQPSVIPAPISTTYARLPPRSLPAAGIDIDPVLWKDLPNPNYGDPRSKSTTPSNGSGEGGGVGTNDGTGIGDGHGPGFGRGRDGNTGDGDKDIGGGKKGGGNGNNPNPSSEVDRIYNSPDVTQRARVLFKPEPQYTEEARKADITGAVILRVVFSRTGEVTNIHAIKTLPFGLTEKAIAAARQIRFVPATRNGQPVSMYMQLEYNFNLY